ncbi:MAG TPA: UDP-N-acetylmuramoyl-L-alanine--D-glutamate ligase [Burkholderiales bacterium]|nr:UDP-N-acetylmuramoyl-L-alanine--D-glutamate ligase [Burkholderiales bacterium]
MLVLGLGDTGLSVARWVEKQGGMPRVADTRAAPPRAKDFAGELRTGPFNAALLEGVDLVCVSPGLSLEEPVIRLALHRGVPVLGDVELFAWHNRGRVLAVTGTNGKTTVTSLLGHLLRTAGVNCEVAGNIGPPVLAAAMAGTPAVWALELSSYQLETTWSLRPEAAGLLNITDDHLDRYPGLGAYARAKARIFEGAATQVLNRHDSLALAMARPGVRTITFGLDSPPSAQDFGVVDGVLHRGTLALIPASRLRIRGGHNVANALAACALASVAAPLEALAAGLASFAGLPHRVELVATRRGVEWYDDSKGTNVGATVAALNGLAKPTILIVGGEGKGQKFAPLRAAVERFCRISLLIGRDAPLIEKALAGLPTARCASLEAAVEQATRHAAPGDAVLLSPACASFDMFRDYKHRGEAFVAAVKALPE